MVLLLSLLTTLIAAPDPGDKTPTGTKEQILKRCIEEFVPLTPGKGKFPAKFCMGSEGKAPAAEQPAHEVVLKYPFAISRYEVTQELFEAVMGVEPSKWKGPRNSVEIVSWDDAVAFCRKLTTELQTRKLLRDDEVIRLPSEAEWEYACRASTTTAFNFGDDAASLKEFAWFTGNAAGNDPPVGKKKPNPWGLYDMHGYIAEWCQDAWHDSYDKAPTDGSAWESPPPPALPARWEGGGASRAAAPGATTPTSAVRPRG